MVVVFYVAFCFWSCCFILFRSCSFTSVFLGGQFVGVDTYSIVTLFACVSSQLVVVMDRS